MGCSLAFYEQPMSIAARPISLGSLLGNQLLLQTSRNAFSVFHEDACSLLANLLAKEVMYVFADTSANEATVSRIWRPTVALTGRKKQQSHVGLTGGGLNFPPTNAKVSNIAAFFFKIYQHW